jgi:hypothetical protein
MPDQSIDSSISLRPPTVTRALGITAAVVLLASTAGQLIKHVAGHGRLFGLVHLFYVDAEQNIPTAFSALLLLFSAVLLLVIAIIKRRAVDRFRWGWVMLCVGFFVMTADESFSLHERLVEPAREMTGQMKLGVLYFTWVIFGIAIVAVLGVFYLKFLLHLPAGTRNEMIVAAVLYLGGALGAELVGGWHAEIYGVENLTFSMLATAEEALEMAGLIIFIRALLTYIAREYQAVRILCSSAAPGSP